MDSNFWGITVASIGTLAEGIEKDMYDGVISIGPFSCMPTTVVHALSKMVQDTKGRFPYLLFACEGLEQTNITTRLEAFMYQAKEHWRRRYAA
jgi:predicted nucleotide-binding protein (sugar kinase/HSP70/actin superfamily)